MTGSAASWLPGRYRLQEKIGAGGMGEVWLALDLQRHHQVAVKRLFLSQGAGGEADRLRFKREFMILARLRAPGIVRAYELGGSGGTLYYTMEHVAGRPLKDYFLEGLWQTGGAPATPRYFESPQALEKLWEIGGEILKTLAQLHAQSLVHRDLKPANILVTPGGTARLIDFGLAREQEADFAITAAGELMGTPNYLAPELIRSQPLDGRADLYALGVIFYELAAGRLPFNSASVADVLLAHLQQAPVPPRELNRAIPPAAGAVILRLLAKEPGGRYATAHDALLALRAATEREPGEISGEQLQATQVLDAAATGALPAGGVLQAPYIGNGPAREGLLAACRRLLAGEGGTLLVSGPSGAGKTRLRDEARAFAAEHGMKLLRGGGQTGGAAAGHLFQDLFAQLAGELTRRPERCADWPRDAAAALAARFPALRQVPALRELPAPPELSPDGEKARLLAALYHAFAGFARLAPLALWLDDLQWADPLSLELLAHLIRSFTGGPGSGQPQLLVLGNFRDDEPQRSAELERRLAPAGAPAARLALKPLGEAELGRLVQALLGLPLPPPERFTRRLHELTGGNPYFATETVKGLVAGGTLLPDAREGWSFSRWAAGVGGTAIALPESVQSVLEQRLDQVGKATADALRSAAVIGRKFRFSWWRTLTAIGEDDLLEMVERAIAAGLVAEAGIEALQFSHDQLRAALLAGLTDLKRRRLHARVLAVLEAEGDAGADAGLLAHHALEAGLRDEALHHGHCAAGRLLDLGQIDGADSLLQRIEALFPPDSPMPDGARAEHLHLNLRMLLARGDVHATAERAPEVIAAALRAGRPDLAMKTWRAKGVVQRQLGLYEEALAAYGESHRLARELQDKSVEALSLLGLGNVRMNQGRMEEAAGFLADAEALVFSVDDERNQAFTLNTLAIFAYERGDIAGAGARSRQGLALYQKLGDVAGEALCTGNLAEMALLFGRLGEAQAALLRAVELNRTIGQRRLLPDNLGNLGHLYTLQMDWPSAEAALGEGLRATEGMGPEHAANIRLHRARMRRLQGDFPGALAEQAAAGAAADASGQAVWRARCAVSAAELALRRGDAAGARAAAAGALALARGKFPASEALALALQAAAAARPGSAVTEAAFDEARDLAAPTGDVELLILIELLRARALHDAGRPGPARAALAQARERALAHGMGALAREAETPAPGRPGDAPG